MVDYFANTSDSPTAPARRSFTIAPHATNPLVDIPKAIYVGTGGDLVVRLVDDSADRTFKNVPTGSTLDVRASHVRATSTAADLVGLA